MWRPRAPDRPRRSSIDAGSGSTRTARGADARGASHGSVDKEIDAAAERRPVDSRSSPRDIGALGQASRPRLRRPPLVCSAQSDGASARPRKRQRRSRARSQRPDTRRRSVREDRLQAKQHSCEIGVASMTDDARVSKICSIRQRQERAEEPGPRSRKNMLMINLWIKFCGVDASYASLGLGHNLRRAEIPVRISVAH